MEVTAAFSMRMTSMVFAAYDCTRTGDRQMKGSQRWCGICKVNQSKRLFASSRAQAQRAAGGKSGRGRVGRMLRHSRCELHMLRYAQGCVMA